jgi:Leucine-rich repeat (LRR) protein
VSPFAVNERHKLILYYICSWLDISFNRLGKIENLESLVGLQKLFLISNKIQTIENLSSLNGLTMLELGDNKIRVSLTSVVDIDSIL